MVGYRLSDGLNMRKTASFILVLLVTAVTQVALAQPNRDSLIEAWESYVASMPGTSKLEAMGDGVYRFHDTDLPYEGELKIVGALVRPAESMGVKTEFSHLGMVEFQLVDLPPERMGSQSYYYWLTDRQMLHYSAATQTWVDPATYQASITEHYAGGTSFGAMSFMLNYGIWVFLIALIGFVFVMASKQGKKARSIMDETTAINQKARENIDRSQAMQDEVMTVARESRDLQTANNELLQQMLETLKR